MPAYIGGLRHDKASSGGLVSLGRHTEQSRRGAKRVNVVAESDGAATAFRARRRPRP